MFTKSKAVNVETVKIRQEFMLDSTVWNEIIFEHLDGYNLPNKEFCQYMAYLPSYNHSSAGILFRTKL